MFDLFFTQLNENTILNKNNIIINNLNQLEKIFKD